MMRDFHNGVVADGGAKITWAVPGRSMHVLLGAGFAELAGLVDRALGQAGVAAGDPDLGQKGLHGADQ